MRRAVRGPYSLPYISRSTARAFPDWPDWRPVAVDPRHGSPVTGVEAGSISGSWATGLPCDGPSVFGFGGVGVPSKKLLSSAAGDHKVGPGRPLRSPRGAASEHPFGFTCVPNIRSVFRTSVRSRIAAGAGALGTG